MRKAIGELNLSKDYSGEGLVYNVPISALLINGSMSLFSSGEQVGTLTMVENKNDSKFFHGNITLDERPIEVVLVRGRFIFPYFGRNDIWVIYLEEGS